ncbi:prolactin-inducible protein homolog isoform X2 [Arvicanthis niloticus]|uniref:prolactin-inducible protein homolog isoform X2 n=1 Tax=Arvicanthis niloticus TaxID=61156 RepID=UPI00402B2C80
MQGFSFTFSAATLFLVLCLQLGINKGQDDGPRRPLLFDLKVPSTAAANEEITVALKLQTQYRECLVIKTYLVSNLPIGGSFAYVQTGCLCNDHPTTFYWDFDVPETIDFAVVVDIVKEKGICPNDVAVVPITGDRYVTYHTVYVN